jgi:adenosylhomocysteine nucleosidase
MILITFALPHESGRVLPQVKNKTRIEGGALPVYRGHFEGRETVVVHTGMGPDRAHARAGEFLARFSPRLVVAAGYGGGLDARLKAGSLVLAQNYSHPELLALARASARNFTRKEAVVGNLSTQGKVAESVSDKRALAQATGAIAVDMETGAIFGQCRERNIPMLAVRAISDSMETPLPVPGAVWFDAAKQKPRVFALLVFLAKNPGRLPSFAGFVRGTGLARKELTGFLREFVRSVGSDRSA